MSESAHALYRGHVMHRRRFPVRYRFAYPVFALLLDLDHIEALAHAIPFFSYNRFNLASFHQRDHGPRDGSPLRPWLRRLLDRHGVHGADHRVMLLSMPRILGYTFNPLSVYYCFDGAGALIAVVCEVKNTFGEQHCYVLHEGGRALPSPVRQTRRKVFHVSPFMAIEGEYAFRLSAPSQHLQIGIRHQLGDATQLTAVQTGTAVVLSARSLLGALLRMPLVTFKVTAMIHWRALRIWLAGATVYRKPEPPIEELDR